jgi:hypothetical protein
MTVFEWVIVSLTAAGFLVTVAGVLGGCVWAVAKIKSDVDEKVTAERTRIDLIFEAERENDARSMKDFANNFADEQKAQDHNVGEMGAAIRQYVASVEKEMHKIEIWGRDHYVQKPDFEKTIDAVRQDIRGMTTEIKADIRSLATKIDATT